MAGFINCPHCGNGETVVTETRRAPFNEIRRTRKCKEGHSFRTFEIVEQGNLTNGKEEGKSSSAKHQESPGEGMRR